tara:strand:+ start:1389 stop:1850 length:462 start_codon:yes stop_codon:yes gene_type:complete
MYVLIADGAVSQYPYSINLLKQAHPNVSFPKTLSAEVLNSYNVFEVQPSDQPSADHTKNIVESNPVLQDGNWVQQWTIQDASAETINDRTTLEASLVRAERGARLEQSDWTQMADSPLTDEKKAEWATYRQSLRDMTSQSGFPFTVNYPTEPS